MAEGVFAKFPDLTVVLMESGVTWLPGLSLAADQVLEGAAQRGALGGDPPATIVRERVRLTLQPFDGAAGTGERHALYGAYRVRRNAAVLHRLSALAVRRHATRCPTGLDPALAQKIMVDNPLRTYARLRETAP